MLAYLTKKQQDIVEFIQVFTSENDYSPSLRDIGEHFQIQVKAVQDHISAIKRKGYLRSEPKKANSLEIISAPPGIPIYGKVAAGGPILAIEDIEGYIKNSDEYNADVFALRIVGDSMIEAGLVEGDIVLVQKQSTANDRDIVIALIGDEATVKRYRVRGGDKTLEPANPKYAPIVNTFFQIIGKVIELRRKY